jgi:hypothetical protein
MARFSSRSGAPSRRARSYGVVLLVVCLHGAIALSCTPGAPASKPAEVIIPPRSDTVQPAMLPPSEAQFPELAADVACSRTRLRTGLALLTWVGGDAVGQQPMRLDAAIEKDGFERGEFVTAEPVAPGAVFRPATPRAVDATKSRGFAIRIAAAEDARVAIGPRAPSRVIVVENLEPGVNYFLRLAVRSDRGWSPAPTIRVQAPTCPADTPRN